ncbi:MAG: hypothetical protein M1294_07960 [Firmicutes bacterium]|jgi:peptidoglycan/xylan/chitin deacetylase (PgdA/CDA1 family)|nr:hypothetical protein [Bacillota bacterium]MCL5012558.1 hypothetical protein [Bacillota bacterium]
MTVYGLIRFDIEDFVTQESDDALEFILDVMDEFRIPASYGIVGKKAQSLHDRQHQKILQRLATKNSLGFHSTTHSEHPTLAEELAEMDYEQGVKRFIERESVGVDVVAKLIKAPRYFTQPGGNWVPQAITALVHLDMPVFFSDSWNSYIATSTQPLWIEDIVHWSVPVLNPRPFAMKLPDNMDDAVTMVEQASSKLSSGDAFMVMVHPTELVTTKFWDAVNFEFGATTATLRKAPLRSRQDRKEAFESFRSYIRRIASVPHVEWVDVVELSSRLKPLSSPHLGDPSELLENLSQNGLGPTTIRGENFSAADEVVALALLLIGTTPGQELPRVRAPQGWGYGHLLHAYAAHPESIDTVESGAREIIRQVRASGCLPRAVGRGSESIENWAFSAIFHLSQALKRPVDEFPPLPLTFLDYVKEPDQLHWDWPIFPPNFQPYRLWQETRRLAWSLKPAQYRS